MKFGVRLYGTDPDDLTAKAQAAESLGYESLWRGDHLLLPERISTSYPYLETTQGQQPFTPAAPVLDTLMMFAFIARATSRIRLAVGVYILPLRDPRVVARAVQTLDILSGGRITLGVGVGWLAEEFDALERDFHARGRATSEAMEVLTRLWTEDVVSFEGEFTSFGPVRFEPKPVQRPHPPMVVGGESRAALERAARHGDGWYGHLATPEEVAPVISRLGELRREYGREERVFEITVRVRDDVSAGDVERYASVGVDRLVLQVGSFEDTTGRSEIGVWERVAEQLGGAFAEPS